MNDDIELHNKWLGGEKLDMLKYLHNDCVQIVAGQHRGEKGSVVSIIKFDPASYVVESKSGRDVEVKESEIEPINS